MEEPSQSLIDRAVERLSPKVAGQVPQPPRVRPVIDWRFAVALAALIALGPLLTISGAWVLADRARGRAAQLRAQAAPRIAANAADIAARDMLREAVREAPVAVWLDRAAAVLPAEARVSRMAIGADGRIELEITAPDPDPVRAALRRDAMFARFLETGQRRAGAMIAIGWRRLK